MQPTSFTLQKAEKPELADLIIIDGAVTRIKVYNLTRSVFQANTDELRFYGSVENGYLLFETIEWVPSDLEYITAAIHWYGDQIGQPKMALSIAAPAGW